MRRDSRSRPRELNQNLFRTSYYMNTSSFFDAVSVNAFVIRDSGPFHWILICIRRILAGAVDFRVGRPWAKTALVTGWGANDDHSFLNQTILSKLLHHLLCRGLQHQFGDQWNVRAVAEDLRTWRIVGVTSGIARRPFARSARGLCSAPPLAGCRDGRLQQHEGLPRL